MSPSEYIYVVGWCHSSKWCEQPRWTSWTVGSTQGNQVQKPRKRIVCVKAEGEVFPTDPCTESLLPTVTVCRAESSGAAWVLRADWASWDGAWLDEAGPWGVFRKDAAPSSFLSGPRAFALLPGCHKVSSFPPPRPSTTMFVLWSQPWIETSETICQSKPFLFKVVVS